MTPLHTDHPVELDLEHALPADVLAELQLEHGSHEKRAMGVCAMEAVAWLAGEPHSDAPACTCPVLGAFVRNWNDNLDAVARNQLLRPVLTPETLAGEVA